MRKILEEAACRIYGMLPLIRKIWNRAVDMIYPPCCPFCDRPVKDREGMLSVCSDCQEKTVYITKNWCMKCGKNLMSEKEEFCPDCKRHGHAFDQARSILSYQKQTREALYRFKKGNRKEYADFFGKEICRLLGRWIFSLKADGLIPVPMYDKNERERGYNQVVLLAKVIGRTMGLPVRTDLLYKQCETRQQKNLGREDRKKNLEEAFVVFPEDQRELRGRVFILVDDIYTTGATVDAASKVLKQAGVKKIFVVTVAIGG